MYMCLCCYVYVTYLSTCVCVCFFCPLQRADGENLAKMTLKRAVSRCTLKYTSLYNAYLCVSIIASTSTGRERV